MELRHILRDQNHFNSLFRVKFNNNRDSRNLVTTKRYIISLKMLSCNRKLRYRRRNSMEFTNYIQMIQGTTKSLSCGLKKISLKYFVLSAKQPVSRGCDCQWFHWITDTPIARHTQETYPVPTAIDQWGEQTINKDVKTSFCYECNSVIQSGRTTFLFVDFKWVF